MIVIPEPIGYFVVTRHPAPRTHHGWTYTPLSAIISGPNAPARVQNPYNARKDVMQLTPRPRS
jgi:hypothetical protein